MLASTAVFVVCIFALPQWRDEAAAIIYSVGVIGCGITAVALNHTCLLYTSFEKPRSGHLRTAFWKKAQHSISVPERPANAVPHKGHAVLRQRGLTRSAGPNAAPPQRG